MRYTVTKTSELSKGSVVETDVSHLQTMADIFKNGQQLHHDNFPDIFCPPADKAEIEYYLRGYLKPKNPFRTQRKFTTSWIIEDQVAGYLLYQLSNSSNVFFGKNKWHCFVDDIAIHPEYSGRGGASTLLNDLSEKLSALDNCTITAQVWRGNEASEALFKKFHFDDYSKNYICTLK